MQGGRVAGGLGGVAGMALKVGQEDYWLDQIARDREEDFSGHGESPGRFVGESAITSGLVGVAPPTRSGPCSAAWTRPPASNAASRCRAPTHAPSSRPGPLLAALREHAANRGVVDLDELARSKALAGDVRALEAACRAGGARRVKVETAERVCRMLLKVDPKSVYGEAFHAAWQRRGKRIDARWPPSISASPRPRA
jgi:hypothetical protein